MTCTRRLLFILFVVSCLSAHVVLCNDGKITGRLAYASALDTDENVMYIHGGFNSESAGTTPLNSAKNYLSDVLRCDLISGTCTVFWASMDEASPQQPSARAYHNAHITNKVKDRTGRFFVIFGGMPYQQHVTPLACGLNDIWAFDLMAKAWIQIKENTAACPTTTPISDVTNDEGKKQNSNQPEDTSSPTGKSTLWVMFSFGLAGVLVIIGIYVFREWQKCRKFVPARVSSV